jgi:hypothetical protein
MSEPSTTRTVPEFEARVAELELRVVQLTALHRVA